MSWYKIQEEKLSFPADEVKNGLGQQEREASQSCLGLQ